MNDIGKLSVAAHLWCMCGADLGEPSGFVKCSCGMSYQIMFDIYRPSSGWFDVQLRVVDDVRPDTVRYMALATKTAEASKAFKALFASDGIPLAGVSRQKMLAAKARHNESLAAEHAFIRSLEAAA